MNYVNVCLFAQMNLAVHSHESISTLLELVTKFFSDIPNTDARPITHDNILPFTNHMERIIIYESRSSTHLLSINWQTPSLYEEPNNCISNFIIRLLNCYGEGSLYMYLESQNLATTVIAKLNTRADSFYLFRLDIQLTDAGMKKLKEVIKSAFEYIHILKRMSTSEFSQQWNNYIEVGQVVFDYFGDSSSEEVQ